VNILLEGEDGGKWSVMVVPTTTAETDKGAPGPGEVGMILLGVANDVLGQHFKEAGASGSLIQLPRLGEKIPPPAGP